MAGASAEEMSVYWNQIPRQNVQLIFVQQASVWGMNYTTWSRTIAIFRVFVEKVTDMRSHISPAAWEIPRKAGMNVPANRVEFNRRIPTVMGSFNWLPCAFELEGKRMNGSVSKLRWTCWKLQLGLSILYALYINLTLVINVSRGIDTMDHLLLGMHLTRAMFSATFSYWAYQMFIVHFSGLAMLYEWAQSSHVLTQRPVDTSKESLLQDWLLVIAPCTVYCFAPLLNTLFLWRSSSNQFVFALLPATVQQSMVLRLVAAAYEFHVVIFWMAVAQCGFFHWIAFLRVIQRELINNVADIE